MSQDLLSFLDEPGSGGQQGPMQSSPRVEWHAESQDANIFGSNSGGLPQDHRASQKSSTISQNLFEGIHQEDDEDFGDFEDASPAAAPVPSPAKSQTRPGPPKPKPPAKDTSASFPSKAPSKSTPTQTNPPPTKDPRIGAHPFAGRMDFLFEDDNDDYDAGTDELGDLANNPEAAMEYSKRIIAEQAEAGKGKGKGKQPVGQRGGFVDLGEEREMGMSGGGGGGEKNGGGKAKDPNVLFDADDVSDDSSGDGGEDDDFGDFETSNEPVKSAPAQNQSRPEPPSAGIDLLGLDDEHSNHVSQEGAQMRPLGSKQQSNGNHQSTTSAAPNLQQNNADDSFWDDFETPAPAAKATLPSPQPQQDDSWPDFETSAPSPPKPSPSRAPQNPQPQSRPDHLPPTNVPPPIVLLSLFPSLFSSADSALFSTTAKLPLSSRTALLAHPATHQFLRGYLSHMTVLARIIAGRKLRWKRDQRLSQGMRIGPAAAGGRGGMKLTGLDKSEVAKEDREVVDTIRLYRAQIGKLRTAVTGASSAPGLPKLPAVPDVSETMPVKALKQSEGGITAREACALCGLRREERVVKIDEGVEDSFGEWWVQGMSMHKGCKDFWEEHENKLKSR